MITAILSGFFRDGGNNTDFCTDWPFLSVEERKKIAGFVKDLGEGTPVVGKNKPSHVNDNFDKIYGTDGYEQNNYWHYHCGESWLKHTYKAHTVRLKFNPNGQASCECIHYYKESEDKIVIVGYSRNHIPFLLSDIDKNPFFD